MSLKINLRHIRVSVLLVAFFILGTGFGYWSGRNNIHFSLKGQPQVTIDRTLPADKQDLDFGLFWTVWDSLGQRYLEKSAVVPKQMIFGAIKGMTAALGDPYTVFLPPEENSQAKEDLNGAFDGVGIQLGYSEDQVLSVVAPLEGTPAKRAGVRAGDLILKIDEKVTDGVSLPEAVKLIRGPKGTSVKLTLLHENEGQPFEVSLNRQTIVVPSVELAFVEDGRIAHLKLTRFGDRTNEEWLTAVEKIVTAEKLEGIVLDMRNNPGGYLSGAVFISSEFLSDGVVVQQQSSGGGRETFSVDRVGKLTGQPVAVLINKGSASASEIVAGALKDHGRAKVVGEVSYGKGTVQEAEDLPGGSGLHITVAKWLTPEGNSIDKEGIAPDVEVTDDPESEDVDEQLLKAVELLLD